MRRVILASCCVVVFACAPVVDGTEGPLPLYTHDLQVTPGCYTEPDYDAMGTAGSMAEFLHDNASMEVQIVAVLNRLIQEDPTAESWQIDTRGSMDDGLAAHIQPVSRGVQSSQFEITLQRAVWVPSMQVGGAPELIETTSVAFGSANARATMVDFGQTFLRWTDFAFDLRGIGLTSGTSATVTLHGAIPTAYATLRGCDPETGVSFSSSRTDGTVECRTALGAVIDCQGVDLWP